MVLDLLLIDEFELSIKEPDEEGKGGDDGNIITGSYEFCLLVWKWDVGEVDVDRGDAGGVEVDDWFGDGKENTTAIPILYLG